MAIVHMGLFGVRHTFGLDIFGPGARETEDALHWVKTQYGLCHEEALATLPASIPCMELPPFMAVRASFIELYFYDEDKAMIFKLRWVG